MLTAAGGGATGPPGRQADRNTITPGKLPGPQEGDGA